MKTNLLILSVILSLLVWQCSPEQPIASQKVDYDLSSAQLMKDLAPQIVGKWILRQVHVKYLKNDYYQSQTKVTKDSTFQNLATLTIVPAAVPRTAPRDLRRGEYDGSITYGNKTYPIQFNMLASYDWVATKKGPQTFFLFEYGFPTGSHLVEPEEAFLKNLGLVGDNFSLETTIGQPTMIWRGANRGVEQIELVKQ